MIMNKLGLFNYHRYKILFAVNDEETVFNVTQKEHNTITVLYSGSVLGEARDIFEDAVYKAIGRTSRSDVECFMQTGR